VVVVDWVCMVVPSGVVWVDAQTALSVAVAVEARLFRFAVMV
jgi:hypothetical protein